jgi:hypothetical protein
MEPLEAVISVLFSRTYKREFIHEFNSRGVPYGGGVEYLHRDEKATKREVSKLRKQNMVTGPTGLGPENDCAGENQ